MSSLLLVFVGLAMLAAGYFLYSKFLGAKVFRLSEAYATPAHTMEDGVDYVPTNKYVLWGHHFTSVAGAAPIVGPAVAVIWGWLPAFLWVTLGTIFFAGMHDLGALWASVRNRGQSIGSLSARYIGRRGANLFLVVIFLLLLMVAHLAPPVLSHPLARYWDREDWWLRYATAYNWVQCALPLAGLPLVIGMQVVALLGVPVGTVVPLGLTLFVGYALWQQWLLARHGLDLSRGRAAVVVALVHLGTYALAFGPIRVFGWLSGAGA